ncbi:hypothetical protein EON68_01370 [archaeon]|nr:MAG: hypothetical protein EON68_01370 [archaeon]
MLSKGLKGSVAAVRAVGDVTFGAIEAVPMVGTAVGMTVNMIKKGVNVARRRERRGHLLIINASLGRTLQTRKITSARGSSAVKAPATVTAMTFAPNGHQLFVADARGAVHMFTVEADVVKQQVKPLRSHAIVWGEGAASFTSLASPIRQSTSAAYSGAGGGSLRAQSGRVDEGAASSESASIYLTSLSYRPLDSALRCPLLIGMDNTGHLRALRLQPPTYAEPKPAAGGVVKTGARVAVGAMGAVTGAISIPTSMVATEVAYIMYTAGLPTNLSDVTGASLSSIGSGAFGSFGSNAFIGVGMTRASSTSSTGSGSSSSGGGSGRPLSLSSAAASTVHTAFAVCHNLDALFVGTPSGEMYLLLAHPPAADRSLAAKLVARGVSPGGMLMPGRLATLGCGVAPTQVASKMRGHVNAISSLALNKDEDVLVSCDASGVLLVWERMPLAKAEATGGAVGYIFDESSRESASSSIGSSSSFAQRHASGSSIGRASSAHAPPAGASTSPSQGSLGAPPRAPGGALRMLPTSWMRGGR